MIIDILSDLHIDFYFRKKPTAESIKKLYAPIFTNNQKRNAGDVLIIAGDIGHKNKQNILVLDLIKEVFEYKYIVCVLGNHDYYLLDKSSAGSYNNDSMLRVKRMSDMINKRDGMYCLDGNVVELEGIRFGGCDSWYDGEYIKQNFDEICSIWNVRKDDYYINQLWENSLNDANYIYNMNWQEYAQKEKEKIENIYKDVDVMITHVNPSVKKEHTSLTFRDCETTGFFTFDGSKYLKEGSMKYWVYGHTHERAEHDIAGVRCICNPMGYPNESGCGEWTQIRNIEIFNSGKL